MQRRLFEPRNMCSEEPSKLVDVHAFLRFDGQGPGFILHEESGGLVAVHDDMGDPAREEDFRSRLLDHLDGDIGDAVVVAKIVGSDEAVLACDHPRIELRRDAGVGRWRCCPLLAAIVDLAVLPKWWWTTATTRGSTSAWICCFRRVRGRK